MAFVYKYLMKTYIYISVAFCVSLKKESETISYDIAHNNLLIRTFKTQSQLEIFGIKYLMWHVLNCYGIDSVIKQFKTSKRHPRCLCKYGAD